MQYTFALTKRKRCIAPLYLNSKTEIDKYTQKSIVQNSP